MERQRKGDCFGGRGRLLGILSATVLLLRVGSANADISLPPISVGVGVQTSAHSCSTGCIYSDGTIKQGDSNVQGFEQRYG